MYRSKWNVIRSCKSLNLKVINCLLSHWNTYNFGFILFFFRVLSLKFKLFLIADLLTLVNAERSSSFSSVNSHTPYPRNTHSSKTVGQLYEPLSNTGPPTHQVYIYKLYRYIYRLNVIVTKL